jgi:glycosyltransferase involved in cell wall biosynthesis
VAALRGVRKSRRSGKNGKTLLPLAKGDFLSRGVGVSVCVPVYNGATHLRDCLESVARQEGVDLEVVVRDDGSADGSLELVRALAAEFPGVSWNIERNRANLGMVGNWNACLRAASGEFVKMMGQDDLLLQGCLQAQARALGENPAAALCISAADLYSAGGRRIFTKRRKWAEGFHGAKEVVGDCVRRAYNPLGEPVVGLARRAAMVAGGGYDEGLRYWVDVDMWFQVLRAGGVEVRRAPLCGFRIHRGAASFSLQGDSYAEFLEIAKRYAPGSAAAERSLVQRLQAGMDSLARLAIYRVFG